MAEAKKEMTAAEKKPGRDSYQWRSAFSRYNEAKTMLKWYQGETRRADPDKEKGEELGAITYQDSGLMGKLVREAKELVNASNLGTRFKGRTFSTFDQKRNQHAYDVCNTFIKGGDPFTSERNSLIIFGAVGTGKTHLAASVTNALLDKGIPVLFGTYLDHLEALKQEFNSNAERTYLARMKSVPLLVLDDVGREKQTDWTKQVMFDVINHRYEHLAPILITTNMSRKEFSQYMGSDTYSRLCEMSAMVETKGEDYRKEHR